jgi:hypothetical protein
MKSSLMGEQPLRRSWSPRILMRAIGVVALLRQPGELRWSPVALRTRLATRVPVSRTLLGCSISIVRKSSALDLIEPESGAVGRSAAPTSG